MRRVVVVAMGLKQDGTLKANLLTCYQADNSIGKIGGSPAWSRTACLALLRVVREPKKRPLIRYAGSAAETSIDSKPIGDEFERESIPRRVPVKRAWRVLIVAPPRRCLRANLGERINL